MFTKFAYNLTEAQRYLNLLDQESVEYFTAARIAVRSIRGIIMVKHLVSIGRLDSAMFGYNIEQKAADEILAIDISIDDLISLANEISKTAAEKLVHPRLHSSETLESLKQRLNSISPNMNLVNGDKYASHTSPEFYYYIRNYQEYILGNKKFADSDLFSETLENPKYRALTLGKLKEIQNQGKKVIFLAAATSGLMEIHLFKLMMEAYGITNIIIDPVFFPTQLLEKSLNSGDSFVIISKTPYPQNREIYRFDDSGEETGFSAECLITATAMASKK